MIPTILLSIYLLSFVICYIFDAKVNHHTYHKFIPIYNTGMLIYLIYLLLIDDENY